MVTVYVAKKGGSEDAYEASWACAWCGSFDLEQWPSGRVTCRSCHRFDYLARVNPFVEELEDGGLAVEGPGHRLARYTKGVWISYRHTDPNAPSDADLDA